MRPLAAALLSAPIVAASYYTPDVEAQLLLWDEFKVKFNKSYTQPSENMYRFDIFVANLKVIDARNAAEVGTAVHGITTFADLSPEEFKRSFLNYRPTSDEKKLGAYSFSKPATPASFILEPLPKGTDALVDWTGIYTTAVKYQGFCGSCWAFSAVEQIESDYLRLGGNISAFSYTEALSVQQPTSCIEFPKPGVGGCDGGWTENVFEYAEGGLETVCALGLRIPIKHLFIFSIMYPHPLTFFLPPAYSFCNTSPGRTLTTHTPRRRGGSQRPVPRTRRSL